MSISKVEFRMFAGPAQVNLGGLDKPTIIEMRFGPKGDDGATGATGPAGPNSVTSATTSDGTAELSFSSVTTELLTVTEGLTFNTGDYNFATGAAQALKDALEIASADITDATIDGDANKEKLLKTNDEGQLTITTLVTTGAILCNGYISIYKDGSTSSSINADNITATRAYQSPNANGTLALTSAANGEPDKLTGGTISGTTTFNSTSYAFGTGAQTALKSNLDLFTLLTVQESDSASYTANGGSASASQDGDFVTLSAATANQRPNAYRYRNFNRNPGSSGAANVVMPLWLASAGTIIHSGSGANGASFRCGIGMVVGASAVAANANATNGRGCGWRIAWNNSTSKLEFNLWAHNGTTYVEGAGIDTGLGATNLDGFFNVVLRLTSDGTVMAYTWFGSGNSASSVPSMTPTVTLAGGPTSGSFANLGIPLWIAASDSTTAPSVINSIITRIINRKLVIG